MQRPGHTGRKALATKKATWKVGGQHTMDDWTCHLRHCANILCRTNSRRTLSKVTPTAICFNGIPTFGIHGLKLKDKISKKIGTRKKPALSCSGIADGLRA